MKHTVLFFLATIIVTGLTAQTDSAVVAFSFGGYTETYYAYDFNRPADGNRPGFVYAHNRHNEFAVNIAVIRAVVQANRARGNLALMAGTYANANLATEPGTLQNIYEANAGVRLAKTADLWLDAGVFASHIGFESAIGKDCPTLTRSLMAENSPYFETGAKLTYTTPDSRWLFSVLALNGWQRIRRLPGNSLLSGGWQVTYSPSERVTLNSSGFVGTDQPDDTRKLRVFHNFYGVFKISERFGLIAGLDTGWEENPILDSPTNFWFSPILIGRFAPSERVAVAGRIEYYSDPNGVMISTITEHGFRTLGLSTNLDLKISGNAIWRVEAKVFRSRDAIFEKNNGTTGKTNAALTTALAVWF
ncbi:MAG: porin [Saprospiraceae bacterium]